MSHIPLTKIQSVLVCEDHPFIQKGIEVVLKDVLPNVNTIRAVTSGEEAVEYTRTAFPDLAFIDLGLPGVSGATVIEFLNELSPKTYVFVVTSCDNPLTLSKVKQLGVAAIIQKSATEVHLTRALESLGSGLIYLDHYTRAILNDFVEVRFTPKEEEVLREIVKGHSNNKIAEKLGCGLTTVRFHRANIMQKTGMRNAAELTAWYLQGQRKGN